MPQPLQQSGPTPQGSPPSEYPPVVVLRERFGDIALDPRDDVARGRYVGTIRVTVPADRLDEVMRFLRDDPRTRFDMLADLTCVDYLGYPGLAPARFGVTYSLLSTTHNRRLWIKVFVSEDRLAVPTMTGLWASADWFEREVFDMFGVVFTGHPDLRRILTAPGMKYFPLRKDYPLTGLGERESLPVIRREDA
ncbi:MAG: NADH-quinone oxidoreductase subunit C [Phycisphaerae bacterium]|nr:NADH-quinone oxidoreductase subunit C [Phycisphaerae bacterium]